MLRKTMMSCAMLLLTVAAVLSQLSTVTATGNEMAQAANHGANVNSNGHVPTFSSVVELCQWLCQGHSPEYNYGCPPSCDGGVLDSWSKRAARGRRFDDFSFGFDDYLFMKLLGRNLGDRA